MGRVLTNNVQLSYAPEATLGVLPGSPVWRTLEPNSIKKYGADIKRTTRDPISNIRQRRAGTVTDLDSTVEIDADLTLDHFDDFVQGFLYSTYVGFPQYAPSAVISTAYTVASGGALAAGTLLYARGFTNSANNGLQVVTTSSTTTSIKTVATLVAETPPTNAIVEVCGFRGTAGDLTIDSSGNLLSTSLDFTTLNLSVGGAIWIGGALAANQFFTAADTGYARISAIAAHKLTLSKRSQTFTADDGTSTGSGGTAKAIDFYFGRFVCNAGVTDTVYLERSFTFELTYPNLQSPGPGDMYEYSNGNYCNQMMIELPITSKAMASFAFVGLDTPSPTATRVTNAATPIATLRGTAFNTSADVARLRIQGTDESGLTTDFKSFKITLNNNASAEKVVASLGARYINTGIFDVDIEATLLFTNPAVLDKIRNNTTVTMDFSIQNLDGAIVVDIPSMQLGGSVRDFPLNQSVQIKSTAQAFKDATLGTSIGITLLPYVPGEF